MTQRTLLQFFHWYTQDGGGLWKEVAEKAESLAAIGITDVWLPPAYKGSAGGFSVGYDTYDLFDLGEFEQKGTVATKYGDKCQRRSKFRPKGGVKPGHLRRTHETSGRA